MKGLNYIFLILTPSLIAGIVSSSLLPQDLGVSFIALGIILLGVLIMHFTLSRKLRWLFSAAAILLFFSLGHCLMQLHNPQNIKDHYLNLEQTFDVHKITFTIDEVLKPNSYAKKYIAKVNTVDNRNSSGRILVSLPVDSLNENISLNIDDQATIITAIREITPPKNPYQFSYKEYLAKQDVYAQITLDQSLELLPSTHNSIKGLASKTRQHILDKLSKYNWQPDEWAVINALLLGQKQELTQELRDEYAAAGMIHILAISGLHVGILLLLLQGLFKILGNYKYIRVFRSILIITIIWGFAFIAGLSPSIQRAALMFTLVEIGLLFNRKNSGINALLISAFILLVFNPKLIYQVGFQLSYLAVLFILLLQPCVRSLISKERYSKNPLYHLKHLLIDILAVTISAQLGVLPLSLFYFHQFPALFIVANLVIIPFLGIILCLGMLLLLLSVADIDFPAFAESYAFIIRSMNNFVKWISGFDDMLLKNIYMSPSLVVAAYFGLFTLVVFLHKRTARNLQIFQIGILVFLATLYFEKSSIKERGFYVLQQNTQTLLAEKRNKTLSVFSEDSISEKNYTINGFLEATDINFIQQENVSSYYHFGESQILIIDSAGVYKIEDLKPDYVILTNSPKINLNRLIDHYPEAMIIADGSNYRSYINRWKTTCLKRKIPFHSTYEKGFYKIE